MQTLIRIATPADVEPVATTMRVRDAEEVRAGAGLDPAVALAVSLEESTFAWTLEDPQGPVAIFGVGLIGGTCGSPWFLANERMPLHNRLFLTASPRYITLMLAAYPVLFNYVDARNRDSIRWLKRMGFDVRPPVPYGVEGLPFHPFYKVSS